MLRAPSSRSSACQQAQTQAQQPKTQQKAEQKSEPKGDVRSEKAAHRRDQAAAGHSARPMRRAKTPTRTERLAITAAAPKADGKADTKDAARKDGGSHEGSGPRSTKDQKPQRYGTGQGDPKDKAHSDRMAGQPRPAQARERLDTQERVRLHDAFDRRNARANVRVNVNIGQPRAAQRAPGARAADGDHLLPLLPRLQLLRGGRPGLHRQSAQLRGRRL